MKTKTTNKTLLLVIAGLILISVLSIPKIISDGKVAESERKMLNAQEELNKTKDNAIKQLCDETVEAQLATDLKAQGKSIDKISQSDKQTLIEAYKQGCYKKNME